MGLLRFLSVTSVGTMLMVLSGCSVPLVPVAKTPDPVAITIDESIKRSSEERPIGPETPVVWPVYSSKSTTVSFFGDANQLLADVAKGMKWRFVVSGPQPRLPIFVQIDAKDMTMADFLRQVARQLGQRADVVLEKGSLELRYRTN